MINPAFLRYPEEARLLGEMVLGYGELDISFGMVAGKAARKMHAVLHAINRVRSEKSRLDIADALACGSFKELGLAAEYARVHRAMRFCLRVRNQYTHSQWADWGEHGLGFTNVDGDAFASPIQPLKWNSIKLALLQKQEAFFEYTRRCILTLDTNLLWVLAEKPPAEAMPPEMHEPSMHSQWPKSVHDLIEAAQKPRS